MDLDGVPPPPARPAPINDEQAAMEADVDNSKQKRAPEEAELLNNEDGPLLPSERAQTERVEVALVVVAENSKSIFGDFSKKSTVGLFKNLKSAFGSILLLFPTQSRLSTKLSPCCRQTRIVDFQTDFRSRSRF